MNPLTRGAAGAPPLAGYTAVRRAGGGAVKPKARRGSDADGRAIPSLQDHAEAARKLDVAFIDLHATSRTFHAALGPEGSKAAFAQPAPGRLDNTHHDAYGSYGLAQAVVPGLRRARAPAADVIVDDLAFDPAHPDSAAAFAVPPSPQHTAERPPGDEDHP